MSFGPYAHAIAITIIFAIGIVALFPILHHDPIPIPAKYSIKTSQIVNFPLAIIGLCFPVFFKACYWYATRSRLAFIFKTALCL